MNDPVVAVKPIVFLFKGIYHGPLGAGLLLQFSSSEAKQKKDGGISNFGNSLTEILERSGARASLRIGVDDSIIH
jgi:hypothetical protein